MDWIKDRIAELDPKVVAGFVVGALTLFVTKVVAPALGISELDNILDDTLIPGTDGAVMLRVDEGIALAAAAAASWWKENAGTFLRRGDLDDGNPNVPAEAGYSVVELLIGAILLIVFIYVVFAVVD